MKKLIFIPLLLLSLIVSGTNYYVSTTGNDSSADPTNIATPWASWEKAFTSTDVQPGDTIFIRGGLYYTTVITGLGIQMSRSGTSGAWIVYINYPGENPIIDFGNITAGDILYSGLRNNGIHTNGVNYVKLIGLTVRNVKQYFDRNYARGIFLYNGIVTIEKCIAYNCWGHGIHSEHDTDDGGNIHNVINCDSYNNCDSISGSPLGSNAGATGAGFDAWFGITTGETYFTNCRAWGNSDQGYSIPSDGYVKCEGCWSFANNNYVQGDGAGFKMGWQNIDVPDLRREMIRCVAAYNDAYGFFTNEKGSSSTPYNAVKSNHFNNIAYHNGYASNSFGFIIQDTEQADTTEQWRNYTNNISYDNYQNIYTAAGAAKYSGSNNTWDIPLTLTDADFVSLDTTGITAPRQADGSLPDNDCYNYFLHLSDYSAAIDRGTYVGIAFEGRDPDLGPFEYDGYPTDPHVPQISTTYPYNITLTSVTTGGAYIDDGGSTITAKGVCWDTTENPTISDNTQACGSGTANFVTTVTNLLPNTVYHFKAYATNEVGTGYGANQQITTTDWGYIFNGIKHIYNGTKQVVR